MVSKDEVLPRKVPTQARAKATVDALVEATARILVDEGPDGLSTNRIAAVAGVSVGSLYQYFPGKEALVMAVVERHATRVVTLLAEAFVTAHTMPLPEAIEQLVRAIVAVHAEQPELQHAIAAQMVQLGIHHTAPLHARAVSAVQGFLHSRHEDLSTPDCHAAAWMLVTTVMAAVHGAHVGVAGEMDSEVITRELTAMVVRYLTG